MTKSVKRLTVIGYVGIAARQMARAVDASVRSYELSREEIDAVVDTCRHMLKLDNRLRNPRQGKKITRRVGK